MQPVPRKPVMQKSNSNKPNMVSPKSVGKSAARGAAWIYGRMLATQLIHLCTIAVLARELDLRAFGLVALATVALMFLKIHAAQGVNQYIIYDRKRGFEERAKAALWLNIVIGVVALVIGYSAAPEVASYFDEPQLAPILRLLLLSFPFNAMTQVYDAVRNKELHFHTIEIRDTIVALGIAAGSISMALAGFGVWSIVVPAVIAAPVKTIVAALSTRWRPGWSPRVEQWPRILKYASNIIGSSFTSFIITHGDTLLVGKLMGSSLLGVYNLAWQSSNMVSKNIVNLGSKLFFPMLAAVSDDRKRMGEMLRRLLRVLSAFAFPALIGLFVVADDFVHVVYGEKWAQVVLPLRILIVYAIRFSVGSPLGPVLKALGRPDIIFKLGLVTVPFYCAAIWLGSNFGIIGVAVGVTLVRTGFGGLTFVLVARQLQVSTMYLVAPVLPSFAAALLMGVVLLVVKVGWGSAQDGYTVVKLIALIGTGMTAYLLSIRYLFRDVARDIADVSTLLLGSRAVLVRRVLNVTT